MVKLINTLLFLIFITSCSPEKDTVYNIYIDKCIQIFKDTGTSDYICKASILDNEVCYITQFRGGVNIPCYIFEKVKIYKEEKR